MLNSRMEGSVTKVLKDNMVLCVKGFPVRASCRRSPIIACLKDESGIIR